MEPSKAMEFNLPSDLQSYISRLDTFIQTTILPLQHQDDNDRFFDHRRESARTLWTSKPAGLPSPEYERLLAQARALADEAGFYRLAFPAAHGGSGIPQLNLWMAAIRYHLSAHAVYGGGLGLANDLQNEHSVVGNAPVVLMLWHFGSEAQKTLIEASINGSFRATFGLTEAAHGSDATWMQTRAVRCEMPDGSGRGWRIDGGKVWQTGMHSATHSIVFARTSGRDGSADGITAFIVPVGSTGFVVESYEWTLNMPTDHASVSFTDVRVPDTAVLGPLGKGLAVAQTFTHENRIRQAASSCGAAAFCVQKSVEYANSRVVFGKKLSVNQGIQFPLVELATQVEMLRLLILRTAWEMDNVTLACDKADGPSAGQLPWVAIEQQLGHKIGMCNYYANRLATQAADQAIQVHGGMGYSRHLPFEHIWRHFRRYRITEGSEEVQKRKVAAYLFGIKNIDGKKGREESKL